MFVFNLQVIIILIRHVNIANSSCPLTLLNQNFNSHKIYENTIKYIATLHKQLMLQLGGRQLNVLALWRELPSPLACLGHIIMSPRHSAAMASGQQLSTKAAVLVSQRSVDSGQRVLHPTTAYRLWLNWLSWMGSGKGLLSLVSTNGLRAGSSLVKYINVYLIPYIRFFIQVWFAC